MQLQAASGLQVAGEADFDWHLTLRQLFDQFGILRGSEPMSNSFRAQIQRAPNRLWARALAGVSCEPQALRRGVGELLAKELRLRF